jgi:hypothetical protein
MFGAALSIPIPIIHDLQFPARREGPRDDFRGSFQMQSLQVPNCEERTALDAADDETCTAGTEVPLQTNSRSRPMDHGKRSLAPPVTAGRKCSRLLVLRTMKAIRD